MESINQYGVWFALGYPIIKEIIIPLARRVIPAKVKSEIKSGQEQQKHEFEMEKTRLDAEIEYKKSLIEYKKSLAESISQISKTQAQQVEISRVQGEQIQVIYADTKEIKEALKRPRKAVK